MSIDPPKTFVARAQTAQKVLTPRDFVEARDKHIAAWCDQAASKAEREALAHGIHSSAEALRRSERCDGQASALRALAAMLRGTR